MDLSVIVVNWNTKDLLSDVLTSVFDSKTEFTFEVIVVDNGSEDGSQLVVKKIKTTHKNLHLIENKENLGFSKANNQGIKIAKGEYILLLNSDTKVKKDSIQKLLGFAKSKPDAGVIGARLLNKDNSVQASCFKAPTLFNAIKEYWFEEKGSFSKYAPESTAEVDAVVGAAFLMTPNGRSSFPYLSEKYFFFWEDLDYCRMVRREGMKVIYFAESEIYHFHGSSVRKTTPDVADAWKRLIPGSKIYHGNFMHFLITNAIRLSQRLGGLLLPLLIAVLLIPTVWQLLKPGFFPMQDDLQAFRVYEMDRCFDDLQIPCRWVPDAGYQYGYPQFNFYPPTPYYIGALMHRAGMQYIDAVKILFIVGYFLSAWTIYLLVKELFGKFPAFISALLYSYIPYKAVEVYVRGALSEFWAQIFFPLVLLGIYLVIKKRITWSVVVLGLSIAGLATTHLLMTIIFLPVAAVWAIFWLVKFKFRGVVKLVLAVALGFGLSAFFVLPVLAERQYVHIESLTSGYFDYRQHFVSLPKLLTSMEWGYGSSGFPNELLNLSVGIPQWILGIVGLVVIIFLRLLHGRNKKYLILGLTLVGLTLASIFMMHMKSSFIWTQLPIIWILQFPWRFMAVTIFLVSISLGLLFYLYGRHKYLIGLLALIASVTLYINFFVPKDWNYINDQQKFSGASWEKQLTISIFDYLPIYAELPPWAKAPALPEILSGSAIVTEYKKGSNYQYGLIDAATETTLRLPLFDFPGMEVTVSDKVVPHINNDCSIERYCLGLITFEVPKGKHVFGARLMDTPIRAWGNRITLAALALLTYLVVKSKRDTKRAS